jgi:5-methylcytosine-specific restriction endonuclease McrA
MYHDECRKLFVDIHVAPITKGDQKRILITNHVAIENSCNNLATTTKKFGCHSVSEQLPTTEIFWLPLTMATKTF